MKKNNTLKVMLIALLVTYLLTWILPVTYFSTELYTDARFPIGLFDMFNYPTLSIIYFGQIALYLLAVGAFYGVFEKTGVFHKISDKIAKLFKGKEFIFFATVIVLLATITAFCGFTYELIFVLPLLAAIILMMGYDKITVALTFLGAIASGIMGSLFASSVAGVFAGTLSTDYTDLIWWKLGMLVLGIAATIFCVLWRNKKTEFKKETDKDLIPEKVELKTKKGKVRKSWPGIVIFDLILVLMILGALDFSGAFGVDIFEKFHDTVMSFTIGDYAIFSKILGSTMSDAAIGTWTSLNFMIFIIMATIVLAIIYRIKPNELFEGYKDGSKKLGLAAILSLLAYTILISTSNNPVILTILKPLLQITDGFNAIWLAVSAFITGIFNIDATYTASALLPYVMSIVDSVEVYPLIGFICQAMQGLVLLIAPTSFVLLGVLSYLKTSYTEWLKNIWKLFLILLVLAFILFIIIMNI